MNLTRLAVADLRELIRKDPSQRTAAWAELTYRNKFRRQVERENGQFQPWVPPDLTQKPVLVMIDDPAGELPGPLGDGPLTD